MTFVWICEFHFTSILSVIQRRKLRQLIQYFAMNKLYQFVYDTFNFCLLLFLTNLIADNLCVTGHILGVEKSELKDLSTYNIITPFRVDNGRKLTIPKNYSTNARNLNISMIVNKTEIFLELQINSNLLPKGHVEVIYSKDRQPITKLPNKTHNCFYHGVVRSHSDSKVALSICRGISGMIGLHSDTFYIEPLVEGNGEHVLYKAAQNHAQNKHNCSLTSESNLHHLDPDIPDSRQHKRYKRNVLLETKYVELYLLAAYSVYNAVGDEELVKLGLKQIANYMDLIWRSLNVRIALVGVEVWTTEELIEVDYNLELTFSNFRNWRKANLDRIIKHDFAQLLLAASFNKSMVGMARSGEVCSNAGSVGVVKKRGGNFDIAFTMAHEFGHNMGLSHNGPHCTCESNGNPGCVMDEYAPKPAVAAWSSCSRETLQDSLNKGLGACLFDYPSTIYDGPICGNAFREEGEECDCGLQHDCEDPCCDAGTCRFRSGAVCAMGECCHQCQLKREGVLCREAVNECDLPEYCNGTSEQCPRNVFRQNGINCNISTSGVCFGGSCVSYDDQCRSIWGEGATMASKNCFMHNTLGTEQANCGQQEDGTFLRCTRPNRFCGTLFCEGGQSIPLAYGIADAYLVTTKGSTCKLVSIDHGPHTDDPGYVADGSVCGNDKVCYDHECVTLEEVGIVPCPENCNNNGTCNSENHCHCSAGWAPPNCSRPGRGGSAESGPATVIEIPSTVAATGPTTQLPTSFSKDTTKRTSLSSAPTIWETETLKHVSKSTQGNKPTKSPVTSKPNPPDYRSMSLTVSIVLAVLVVIIFLGAFSCCNRKEFIKNFKRADRSRIISSEPKDEIPIESY